MKKITKIGLGALLAGALVVGANLLPRENVDNVERADMQYWMNQYGRHGRTAQFQKVDVTGDGKEDLVMGFGDGNVFGAAKGLRILLLGLEQGIRLLRACHKPGSLWFLHKKLFLFDVEI